MLNLIKQVDREQNDGYQRLGNGKGGIMQLLIKGYEVSDRGVGFQISHTAR